MVVGLLGLYRAIINASKPPREFLGIIGRVTHYKKTRRTALIRNVVSVVEASNQ
jgi:hypothetical protein